MGQRRHLLEKNLLYVFSVDANVEYGRQDIGFVPGGVRINIMSTPEESRVYHVGGETRFLGEDLFSGTIIWGGDWALAREDNIELLDLRLIIQTDDGAAIETAYYGVFAPGPRSYNQLISEKPKFGSEQKPLEGPIYVAPRFWTMHPSYKWLNHRQCLAFGMVRIIESVARQTTFDVWMMD